MGSVQLFYCHYVHEDFFFFLVSMVLIEKCFLHCPEMIVRFSVDLPNCFPGKKKSGLYSQSCEEDSHFLFIHKGCGSPGFNFLVCLGELEPASLISQENTIRLCCAAY